MNQTLNVNLAHSLFYALPTNYTEKEFVSRAKNAFKEAVLYSNTGNLSDEHFKDMQIVERFLKGGSQTYRVTRFGLGALCPAANETMTDVFMMLSYFEESDVAAISFHYTLKDVSLDTVIGLRQSGAAKKYAFSFGEMDFFACAARIAAAMNFPKKHTEQSFLCEVTRFFDYQDIETIEKEEAQALYGLLSGDEGYSFVPLELCRERLSFNWSSRSFMRVYAGGESFVFLNLLDTPEYNAYLERQRVYGTAIYGGADDYFFLRSNPLSVNHGIFFSVEFVVMLKTLIIDVLTFQTTFGKGKRHRSYYRRIRETREFRRKIILVLEKVDQTAISEIGQLSSILMDSQHIAPIVDQVKYLLELLEGDLTLIYSEHNNLLVTVLTVLGLALAAWQVLLAL